MAKEYWSDACTINCVWLFQEKITLTTDQDEEVDTWRTSRVFLLVEEALRYGRSRPYAWGQENDGWRVYGVPCAGVMPKMLFSAGVDQDLIDTNRPEARDDG
jgi:hypothetical protein